MRPVIAAAAVLVALAAVGCEKLEDRGHWRYTCGDPVCVGYTVKPGAALCTFQAAGDRCRILDQTCDPKDDCNRLLICSTEEPTLVPCPDLP